MRYEDDEARSVGEYCAGNMYACGSSMIYMVGDMYTSMCGTSTKRGRSGINLWAIDIRVRMCMSVRYYIRAMQCRVGAMDG